MAESPPLWQQKSRHWYRVLAFCRLSLCSGFKRLMGSVLPSIRFREPYQEDKAVAASGKPVAWKGAFNPGQCINSHVNLALNTWRFCLELINDVGLDP